MARSRHMRVATWGARRFGLPRLAKMQDPLKAVQDFDRAARWMFKRPPFLCHLEETLGGVPAHWVSVGKVDPRKVILFLHGGAYLAGNGKGYRGLLGRLSKLTGIRVCAPDYRLSHEAMFPAAFDDARAAWDALIAKGYDPENIILGGDSAGGGLMLALLADLCRTGQQPCAAFAMSPWTDLTMTGKTLSVTTEAILPTSRMEEAVAAYLGDQDPADPRASPLFATFENPPPVYIQVGQGEALLDDARRMADRLQEYGGVVTLDVMDTDLHVFQIFDGWIPEAREAMRAIARFAHSSFASASR